MGLFDRLIINRGVNLPLPDDIGTEIDIEYIYRQEFQTKSLESCMYVYDVNIDMSITKRLNRWAEDLNSRFGGHIEESGECEPVSTPEIIDFYILTQDNNLENDYWIEWSFVYTDEIKTIKLKEFRATPNSDRKKKMKEFWKKWTDGKKI